jgi:hypothetical protein
MALVVATPLVALCAARALEELGIATKAIQALPLAQRLRVLRAATGEIAPYLRKRYPLPLLPTLDLAAADASGMTGGAVATWSGGPASVVEDYAIIFASGPTYTITKSFGAFGQIVGPALSWSGSVAVDGYELAFSGTISPGDVYAWSTKIVQDPGIEFAVARIAAAALITARGVDPGTLVNLQAGRDAAMNWAKALGIPGEGELSSDLDTDPIDGGSYGPLGSGETRADAFLYGDSVCPAPHSPR